MGTVWISLLPTIGPHPQRDPKHGQCGHGFSQLLFAGDDNNYFPYKDITRLAHARRNSFWANHFTVDD